jgi:pimeloyl-ACP methyl ester carboxylesterase
MKAIITFGVVLTTAVAFGGCQAKEREGPPAAETTTALARDEGTPKPATVNFTTADGWEIYATYWDVGEGKPAAILLHMLIADRHSYDDFGAKLAAAGFNVLALDSRGHGDSVKHAGKTERHGGFDEETQKSSVTDVAAAKDFLAQKGADTSKLVLVGASIGANFALNYGAGDADVRAVVLLSPGLKYHGVETVAAMAKYGDRPAYLVASEEDRYSADSIGKLHEIAPGAEFKMFENAGHGTKIFGAEPAFEDTLADWLAAQII